MFKGTVRRLTPFGFCANRGLHVNLSLWQTRSRPKLTSDWSNDSFKQGTVSTGGSRGRLAGQSCRPRGILQEPERAVRHRDLLPDERRHIHRVDESQQVFQREQDAGVLGGADGLLRQEQAGGLPQQMLRSLSVFRLQSERQRQGVAGYASLSQSPSSRARRCRVCCTTSSTSPIQTPSTTG